MAALALLLVAGLFFGGAHAQDSETPPADGTAFALEMYQNLGAENQDNLIFSPYSLRLALAMVYAGARGNTETQMAEVLNFDISQEELQALMAQLQADLQSTEATPEEGAPSPEFQLTIANNAWLQNGLNISPEFLAVLDANYGVTPQQTDFGGDPVGSAQMINDWVAEQTNDRIQDLADPNGFDANTRLYLANAVYFSASWLNQFDPNLTREQPFTLLDGTQVNVPMMFKDASVFGFYDGPNFDVVALPYANENLMMLAILPDTGEFAAVEGSLDVALLDEILGSLQMNTRLLLSLPKFEFSSKVDPVVALQAMGMTDAFDPALADFSGIANPDEAGGKLLIDSIMHQAFIKVDETGTEAAAATGIEVSITSMPPVVMFDRPFIFAVYDQPTDSILFMGRVTNPVAE